jgi:hypothetical protein
MKSKKMFYIGELYMNLPDDFEGDRLDCLRLLLKNREESQNYSGLIYSKPDAINCLDILWDNENINVSMASSIMEWNQDKQEWIYK